jgi:CRISPR-associated protein Csx10
MLSSGIGSGPIIDSDIVWDEYGLPIFPGRRLKGLLRESAGEVIDAFNLSRIDSKFPISEIADLFGNKNVEGRINVCDLFLDGYDEILKWLRWLQQNERTKSIFSTNRIKNTISQIRQQTAVDEKGIVLGNSLRTQRVLNKGFKFIGSIRIYERREKTAEKDLRLLTLACLNLKRAGLSRNRGFGRIVVKILIKKEETDSEWVENEEAICALNRLYPGECHQ